MNSLKWTLLLIAFLILSMVMMSLSVTDVALTAGPAAGVMFGVAMTWSVVWCLATPP